MTSRERMLTAFRNEEPDRVPVAPDISNMIPCRRTGKPFWDIYIHADPPLWRAYLDAVRHFDMDGWFIYTGISPIREGARLAWRSEEVARTDERITLRSTITTPDGDLTSETLYYRADPPTVTRKLIRDLRADMPRLRHLFAPITGYDASDLRLHMREVGEAGAVGGGIPVPGMHDLFGWFDGGLEAATEAYVDDYATLREFVSWQEESALRHAEMTIDARPDYLLLGASGLWKLSSPRIFRDLSLPTIQRVTRMAREAGIPTVLHSCGKERALLTIFAEETDLSCANPLEVAPMGDCDLAEAKQAVGDRLALMGNLHTTDLMLRGTPSEVEAASIAAIRAAGRGGGFVLSTGDQCGRDTPDENIHAMVRTAHEHGRYPLAV